VARPSKFQIVMTLLLTSPPLPWNSGDLYTWREQLRESEDTFYFTAV